jgi:hypothetical protein
MHYSYTGGRSKYMPFHLDPSKMFYSYTGSEHRKIYPRGYHPNKFSEILLLSLKSFVAEKSHVAMQKLFMKKKKKKYWKKCTSV